MCNHQKEDIAKEFYRNEFQLKDNQLLILRNIRLGDEQDMMNQMIAADSETKFLAREPGEFNLTLEQETEFIKSRLEDENSLSLVGVIEDRIVANCSVGIGQTKKRFIHKASIGIVVCKDYWNNGIGKIMLQECINWCQKKDVEQLELEVVTQNNHAISMYKNLGFEIYGTKKHAMKYGDGTYADMYYMILFLMQNNE